MPTPAPPVLKLRAGTPSQWNTANTVLADAELGVEKVAGGYQFKIGDGSTAWNQLPYAAVTTAAGDTRYTLASKQGQPNGVATLDGSGKLPAAQLPSLRIGRSTTVASQAAMLALPADDDMQLALRSDNAGTSNPTVFVLNGGLDPATLANWQAFPVGQSLTGAELQANKGTANGYAPLDNSSRLPSANLPAVIDGGTP